MGVPVEGKITAGGSPRSSPCNLRAANTTAYTANDVVGLGRGRTARAAKLRPIGGAPIIIRRSCSIAWTPRRTRNFDPLFDTSSLTVAADNAAGTITDRSF